MNASIAQRSRARHYAMQAIYQWQMTKNPLNIIEAEFHADNDMKKVDVDYFNEIFHGVINSLDTLDAHFLPHLKHLTIDQVDPVTLALLRLSSYEFEHRADVPYRVVINESLNLAKKFGAEDSHKFINGVLDKVATDIRPAEVESRNQNKKTPS